MILTVDTSSIMQRSTLRSTIAVMILPRVYKPRQKVNNQMTSRPHLVSGRRV